VVFDVFGAVVEHSSASSARFCFVTERAESAGTLVEALEHLVFEIEFLEQPVDDRAHDAYEVFVFVEQLPVNFAAADVFGLPGRVFVLRVGRKDVPGEAADGSVEAEVVGIVLADPFTRIWGSCFERGLVLWVSVRGAYSNSSVGRQATLRGSPFAFTDVVSVDGLGALVGIAALRETGERLLSLRG
jgi:hypothetical protein